MFTSNLYIFIFDKYNVWQYNAQTYHCVKIRLLLTCLKISLWYFFNTAELRYVEVVGTQKNTST